MSKRVLIYINRTYRNMDRIYLPMSPEAVGQELIKAGLVSSMEAGWDEDCWNYAGDVDIRIWVSDWHTGDKWSDFLRALDTSPADIVDRETQRRIIQAGGHRASKGWNSVITLPLLQAFVIAGGEMVFHRKKMRSASLPGVEVAAEDVSRLPRNVALDLRTERWRLTGIEAVDAVLLPALETVMAEGWVEPRKPKVDASGASPAGTKIQHEPAGDPNGCRWCGFLPEHHGRRATGTLEIHLWEAPTNEQRKARVLARRNERLKG